MGLCNSSSAFSISVTSSAYKIKYSMVFHLIKFLLLSNELLSNFLNTLVIEFVLKLGLCCKVIDAVVSYCC